MQIFATSLVLVLSRIGVPCSALVGSQQHALSSPWTRVVDSNQQQHEQRQQSFAMGWVTRARGGARVTADGGSRGGDGGGGGDAGKNGQDEIETALVGNFPNRQEEEHAIALRHAVESTALLLLLYLCRVYFSSTTALL